MKCSGHTPRTIFKHKKLAEGPSLDIRFAFRPFAFSKSLVDDGAVGPVTSTYTHHCRSRVGFPLLKESGLGPNQPKLGKLGLAPTRLFGWSPSPPPEGGGGGIRNPCFLCFLQAKVTPPGGRSSPATITEPAAFLPRPENFPRLRLDEGSACQQLFFQRQLLFFVFNPWRRCSPAAPLSRPPAIYVLVAEGAHHLCDKGAATVAQVVQTIGPRLRFWNLPENSSTVMFIFLSFSYDPYNFIILSFIRTHFLHHHHSHPASFFDISQSITSSP